LPGREPSLDNRAVRLFAIALLSLLVSGCVALASDTREEPDPHVPVILPPLDETDVASSPAPEAAPVSAPAPAAAVGPLRAGQEWAGQYVCMGAPADVTVRIESVQGANVQAVFELAAGRYGLSGQYDPASGALDLQPTQWLTQAPGVSLVGLYGTVSEGAVYEGRVTDATCRWFSLRRRS